jgi:hypothetical protein
MNLHSMVAPYIGAVNPHQTVTIRPSTGSVTLANGKRTPVYGPPVTVTAQLQALTTDDLAQVDAVNVTAIRKSAWLNGSYSAINRSGQQGGDLLTDAQGRVWLVSQVAEEWNEWTHIILVLQNGS